MALTGYAEAGPSDGGVGAGIDPHDLTAEALRLHDQGSDGELDIDLRIRLLIPRHAGLRGEGLVSLVSLTPRIPGQLRVEYEGIQGLAVKHITRRLDRTWDETIDDLYDGDLITFEEKRQLEEDRSWAEHDLDRGGRWWERRWYHSLSHERGGVAKRPYTHVHGRTSNLFRVGPVTLSSQFRLRLDKAAAISLFDPPPGHVTRRLSDQRAADDANLQRSILGDDEELAHAPARRGDPGPRLPNDLDLWIGVEPDGNLLEGVYWRARLKPGGRVKLSTSGLDGSVRVRGKLDVYTGREGYRSKILRVEGEVEWEPLTGEVELLVEIALLRW